VTPTANDSAALAAEHTTVWRGSGRSVPWEVAAVLGDPHPWGVLRVTVSTRRLEDWTSRERRRAYLFAFASAILVATGVGVLTSRWVARPLALLGRTMARAHGGVESAPSARLMGPEEFRGLARRYNELRDALVARERESDARAALLALEERARGYDRLALAEQTSTEFAHEIGTPLNTVRGHLQLLRDDLRAAGDQPELERVQLVLAQVDRVAAIVRARLGARAWPAPALRVTDLTAVAQRILQFLDPSLAQAGLSATLEETVPALASCDPALVEQVLLNLLKNAIEALTPGGRVVIRTGTDAEQAWLEVADTGPGLAAQARQHLFEPFATTKEGAGTGLGLAVSRRLARASGGDLVHVPSARGTVWRLTLPVGEPHD
jgi:signal transduction histidine kinase